MKQRHAEVITANASRYLQQLCKHWSHKFSVDFTATHGKIALPFGPCILDADDRKLSIALSAEAADLPKFENVVEDHIRRFAFREELSFVWHDGEAAIPSRR